MRKHAQVKNSMDPSFDSERTAGYRDVVINLNLKCATAVSLGIDLHVCEVVILFRIHFMLIF